MGRCAFLKEYNHEMASRNHRIYVEEVRRQRMVKMAGVAVEVEVVSELPSEVRIQVVGSCAAYVLILIF